MQIIYIHAYQQHMIKAYPLNDLLRNISHVLTTNKSFSLVIFDTES